MRTVFLPGISAFVLLASCLLFAQHQSPPPPTPPPPQTNAPAQGQPAQGQPAQAQPPNSSTPPATTEPAQPPPTPPPTTQPQPSESGQQATATPKASKNPKVEAWQILDAA